jgi:hydroxyacylglutathione hydrolase
VNEIQVIPVCAFKDNYIWVLRRGSNAVVVDPGDAAPVEKYLEAENLTLAAILNTHHHNDHVGGNEALLRRRPAPVFGPYDDRIPTVSARLKEGDGITLPGLAIELSVLEIPGHTRTHIAFHGAGMLFCGDTLFACGCGRLFEGTPREMHESLAKLAHLPDDTRAYCGHEYTVANIRFAKAVDPGNPALAVWEAEAAARRARNEPTVPSTIAREKLANPFLRCDEPAIRRSAERHSGRKLRDAADALAVIRDWKNSF